MLKPQVDKPGSVTHEYRGIELRIAFRCPQDSCIPDGIVISPEQQPRQTGLGRKELIVYDLFEGNWNSLSDALDAGIERAEAFVDAHWVDP